MFNKQNIYIDKSELFLTDINRPQIIQLRYIKNVQSITIHTNFTQKNVLFVKNWSGRRDYLLI